MERSYKLDTSLVGDFDIEEVESLLERLEQLNVIIIANNR